MRIFDNDPLRWRIHGVSYIYERLMMMACQETTGTTDDRPFYYVIDRLYNVKVIVDRAGAIVERYAYADGKKRCQEEF